MGAGASADPASVVASFESSRANGLTAAERARLVELAEQGDDAQDGSATPAAPDCDLDRAFIAFCALLARDLVSTSLESAMTEAADAARATATTTGAKVPG